MLVPWVSVLLYGRLLYYDSTARKGTVIVPWVLVLLYGRLLYFDSTADLSVMIVL